MLTNKVKTAAAGRTLVSRNPSHCARKPSPIAAPRLANAGKQNEQPIAAITAPRDPDLSPRRVNNEKALISKYLLPIITGSVSSVHRYGVKRFNSLAAF
jgi:hypothetical protein